MRDYAFTFFLIWTFTGFGWLIAQANGRQLASIRPTWARLAAMVLTIHAFIAFWLLVRTVEFLIYVASDIPATWKVVKDSWKGVPQVEKEAQS